MEIVKVGGSLCRPEAQAALLDWLEDRARCTPLVVVSGGGRHADLVRDEQRRMGFDELTAHRQALLAMEQQAWWLHEAWRRRHGRHCPVADSALPGTLWTPRSLLEQHAGVEASWRVTSDSLAAWLAARCGASTLWLLKSIEGGEATGAPADWVTRGWVDECFAGYARQASCTVRLLGRQAWGG